MREHRKLLAILLCLVMCLSLLPAAAFAEGGPAEDIAVEEEIVTEEPLEEEALVEEPPVFDAAQESPDPLVVEEAEAEPRCEDAVLVSCEESVAVSDPGALDADALLQGYFEQLLGLKPPVNGDLRGPLDPTQGMTPQQAYLFGRLLDYVRATAAGEPRPNLTVYPIEPDEAHSMTWPLADLAELGIDEINSENADTVAGFIMENFLSADVILQALLNACPFELYWFDKTVGIRFSFRYSFTPQSITFQGLSYTFAVAEAYSDGVTFDEEGIPICLKEGIGTAITAAANNARAIVDSCTAEDDAARITSYVDAICSLTGYNQKAVDENWPYGNPWQVIWVFDGDPGTNVVCEGYAKAFQYLCDLARSSGLFISSIVNCLCVSGVMNTEGVSENKDHMWNLVTMEDGKNYLVDVTNCDSGSNLILKGYKWSYSRRKYTVENITYEYDDKTVSYYTPEELDLSNTDYSPIQPGKWVTAQPALNLHDTIGVRFYIKHAKTVDPRTVKVNVRYASRYQNVNRNFFLAEMTPNQDGEYFIEAVDAASDEMSDPVTLRIFLGDRLVWLEDYTVASIAGGWLTDGEHGRYDTLLRALLQYGWKAQV